MVPSLEECAIQAMENGTSRAAFVMSAVGSLSALTLRMASHNNNNNNNNKQQQGKEDKDEESSSNNNAFRSWTESLEIVSLVGTFAADSKHLHMSVSNANGETFGGHLVAGTVFTTVELVLGTVDGVLFERKHDEATGYRELVVRSYPPDREEEPETTTTTTTTTSSSSS